MQPSTSSATVVVLVPENIEALNVANFIKRDQIRFGSGAMNICDEDDGTQLVIEIDGELSMKDGSPWSYPFNRVVSEFPGVGIRVSWHDVLKGEAREQLFGTVPPEEGSDTGGDANDFTENAEDQSEELTEEEEMPTESLLENAIRGPKISKVLRPELERVTGSQQGIAVQTITQIYSREIEEAQAGKPKASFATILCEHSYLGEAFAMNFAKVVNDVEDKSYPVWKQNAGEQTPWDFIGENARGFLIINDLSSFFQAFIPEHDEHGRRSQIAEKIYDNLTNGRILNPETGEFIKFQDIWFILATNRGWDADLSQDVTSAGDIQEFRTELYQHIHARLSPGGNENLEGMMFNLFPKENLVLLRKLTALDYFRMLDCYCKELKNQKSIDVTFNEDSKLLLLLSVQTVPGLSAANLLAEFRDLERAILERADLDNVGTIDKNQPLKINITSDAAKDWLRKRMEGVPLRVLLIDDDPRLQKELEARICDPDFIGPNKVQFFRQEKANPDAVVTYEPDLILLDWGLTEQDNTLTPERFIQLLRTDNPGIPVFLFTEQASKKADMNSAVKKYGISGGIDLTGEGQDEVQYAAGTGADGGLKEMLLHLIYDNMIQREQLKRVDFGAPEFKIDSVANNTIECDLLSIPPKTTSTEHEFYSVVESVDLSFKDVWGLGYAKDRLMRAANMIINDKAIRALDAKPPSGFLIIGPPGCGKTFLACALAGEVNIPFIQTTGAKLKGNLPETDSAFSPFEIEHEAPVSRRRSAALSNSKVAKLFEAAREMAPCIVFIDEFHEIVLEPDILTCMDGFGKSDKNILVIVATNILGIKYDRRVNTALWRPGRIEEELGVDLPNRNLRRIQFINRFPKLFDNRDLLIERFNGVFGKDHLNSVATLNLDELVRKTAGWEDTQIDDLRAVASDIAKGKEENKNVIDWADVEKALGDDAVNSQKTSKNAQLLSRLVYRTTGWTPAQLIRLFRESVLEAAHLSNNGEPDGISAEALENASIRIGPSGRKSHDEDLRSEEDKEMTAWHEAGHAIARYLLKFKKNKEHRIDFLTRELHAGALGRLSWQMDETASKTSKRDIKDRIIGCLAGRESEIILADIRGYDSEEQITSGASGDLRTATMEAREAILGLGMDEDFGPVVYSFESEDYDSHLEGLPHERVKAWMEEGVKDAAKLLKDNFEALKAVAEALNAKGHLHHDEIAELIEANPPVPQSGAASSALPSIQSSNGSSVSGGASNNEDSAKPIGVEGQAVESTQELESMK